MRSIAVATAALAGVVNMCLAAPAAPAPEQLHVYPATNNTADGMYTVFTAWVAIRSAGQPGASSARLLPRPCACLAYADGGIAWSNGTMAGLAADAATGQYGAVLNHGDISYANDYKPASNNSWVWDQYLNEAEAHLDGRAGPHVCIVGNHEAQHNFMPYLNRTAMPRGSTRPLGRFYSYTAVGPVSVISFSTEHDVSPGSEIFDFVASSLQHAASSSVRRERPWIVVQTHHPFLCTDLLTFSTRCVEQAERFRADLEGLFMVAKVDLFFSGHNHMLEASWPYANGTHSEDLHNAYERGTVMSVDTGYARLDVTMTSLAVDFVNSRTGSVWHNFTLTKDAQA
ncbi:hypothetical protein FNF29_08432 [Cafeteria roenbergensis]|uniref:Calcineurin-like phosphoesterase domain-containing protein n=1 Tax=Cafeteria roenbergensis TaxID=33653 RepID=A0A5A8BZ06_CAFRO|nr:hypothetical protein FNF29_08432 [Cafeteria roenbergensis]|eukprot:KAA0145685.1 hypothetical protein FNF29_08432 [Cafeteria roenbergensis]